MSWDWGQCPGMVRGVLERAMSEDKWSFGMGSVLGQMSYGTGGSVLGWSGVSWNGQGCPGTRDSVLGLAQMMLRMGSVLRQMSWDDQGCTGRMRGVLEQPGVSWDGQECPGTVSPPPHPITPH